MKLPSDSSINVNKLFAFLSYSLLAASLLLVVVVACTRLISSNSTVYDDAYMFLRYANNILDHSVYGWNFEEHSYGCTSVLYTLWILVCQALLGVSVEGGQTLLMMSSFFFSLTGLYLFYRILTLLFPKQSNRWVWLLLLTASFPFLGNSLNGMDTTLAFSALTLMLYLWLRNSYSDRSVSPILLAVVSYLPFLVRPDMGVYVLLFPILWILADKKLNLILPVYGILGILLLADTAIKYWLFGNPLPLPFYAKSQDYLVGYLGMRNWPVDKYWLYFLAIGSLPLLVAGLFTQDKRWKKSLVLLIPMLITLGILTLKVQIMGDHIRFFYPSFPFLFLSGLILLPGIKQPVNVKWIILAWASMSFFGIFLSEYYELKVQQEETEVYVVADPNVDLTQIYSNDLFFSILELLPDGSAVTGSEHGRLSVLFPKLKILDLVGLHDKQIAHEGYSDEYLREVNPEIVWLAHDHYIGLNHDIIHGKHFQEAYEFFPNVAYYGLAIRKDLPNFAELKSIARPSYSAPNSSQ